jgi:hypothetical protein
MKKQYGRSKVDELYVTKNCTMGILDPDNFYVADIQTVKEGKTAGQQKLINMSFFGNLANAAKEICERRAKRAKNKDLRQFLENYRKAQAEITDSIGI